MNEPIRLYLCSSVSQRRIARLLGINLKTVARKLDFLAQQARKGHEAYLDQLRAQNSGIQAAQFDEMESFERSKCLPLSIPLLVEKDQRKILGFRVCAMPAKGPLAKISREKYGFRRDDRGTAIESLFTELNDVIAANAHLTTDQNPRYPTWIKHHFPEAKHIAVEGRRGCIVGQGELKKIGRDPLFALNHTAAMLRANVNRLVRKTWCTTKRPDRLEAHIWLYAQYHNEELTAPIELRPPHREEPIGTFQRTELRFDKE